VKTLLNFFKTTLLGGLLILLPLLLFYVLMGEILDVIIALATPIAELFPEHSFDYLSDPDILAWVLILVVSFLFGLAAKLSWFARLGRWLEAHTLAYLPFYRAVKQVSQALVGSEAEGALRGGMPNNNNGIEEPVYIIETLQDGRLVVLLPFAPASFTGSVKIVEASMVSDLDVSVAEMSRAIAHWGVGCAEFLDAGSDAQ
jgi:uncharacterized membrane protein